MQQTVWERKRGARTKRAAGGGRRDGWAIIGRGVLSAEDVRVAGGPPLETVGRAVAVSQRMHGAVRRSRR